MAKTALTTMNVWITHVELMGSVATRIRLNGTFVFAKRDFGQQLKFVTQKSHLIETGVPFHCIPVDTQLVTSAWVNQTFVPVTVKSRAVDRSTIQFWNFMAKGHST